MSTISTNFTTETDAWLAFLRARGCSIKTEHTYLAAIKNLRLFMAARLITHPSRVTAADLEAWQRHLEATGCAAVTVEMFTHIVQRWFAWQAATARIFVSPALGLVTPRTRRAVGRCLSANDMRRLLVSVRSRNRFAVRDRAILEIAYSTGARLEELARLDLSSLDMRERTVRLFGKGNRERVVPLTRIAVSTIRKYLRRSRPLFLRGVKDESALFIGERKSGRMAKPAISGVIKRRGRQIGLLVTPHDIRRACATHLMLGGASPTVVKELLGHQGYSHLHHYLNPHQLDVLTTARKSKVSQ
jgi:site-specific recombinase XerD